MQDLKISGAAQSLLRCPRCKSKLDVAGELLVCTSPECGAHFPVVDGVPVLLNEDASIFSVDDVLSQRDSTLHPRRSRIGRILRRLVPGISSKIKSKPNIEKLTNLLLSQSPAPRVLVVGGRTLGQGMAPLVRSPAVELVETDVAFGPRTMLICDAHDIPFADESFDAVIAQAVLEHVADPYRCVDEIHRVLKEQGLVYAETPFMVQVHLAPYDFTRFTHLGLRRLFRRFDELESGAAYGPGMALAWAYQYFLWSFTSSKTLRRLLMVFARLTSFYLKYFDYYLIDKAGALDAASGYYFLGRKGERVLSDRELIRLYRGARR